MAQHQGIASWPFGHGRGAEQSGLRFPIRSVLSRPHLLSVRAPVLGVSICTVMEGVMACIDAECAETLNVQWRLWPIVFDILSV
eukprot:1140620-Pelagomonas_calceolata.AAC.2